MTAALARPVLACTEGGAPLFLSACATIGGDAPVCGVAALDTAGRLAFATPLPGRAHGIVPRPGRAEAVVFARRLGRWFIPLTSPAARWVSR